jgi:hypothetical protein
VALGPAPAAAELEHATPVPSAAATVNAIALYMKKRVTT